jgi:hypothetical protein
VERFVEALPKGRQTGVEDGVQRAEKEYGDPQIARYGQWSGRRHGVADRAMDEAFIVAAPPRGGALVGYTRGWMGP